MGTNVNMQRPAVASPAPYQRVGQTPGSAPYRPGQAYGTSTYAHQAPRPVSQSYAQPSQQYQQGQPASNYMRAPSQGYSQSLPQSSQQPSNMNGRYTGQPQQAGYAHQTQATPNSMGYQYANGAGFNRQVSPQKMYSPQPQNAQPRPNWRSWLSSGLIWMLNKRLNNVLGHLQRSLPWALLPRARLTEATRSPQACDRILWESNRRKARWGKGMVKCVTSTWSSRKTGYFSDVADSSVEFSAAQHVV